MPARRTSSYDAEPIAVGKAPKRQARGRRCEHPGCETVLSTYNPDTYCSVHLEPELESEPARTPEPEPTPVMVSSAAADAREPEPPESERESAIFDPTYRAAPGKVERAVTALQAKFVEAPNFEREKWYAERIERVLGDLAASFRHRQEQAAA